MEAPQEELTVPELQTPHKLLWQRKPTPQGETSAPSTEGPYKDAEGNIDLEQIRKEGGELDMACITGVADFGTDAIKLCIYGVPQVPKRY